MEYDDMTGRAILLASAVMAVSGLGIGSAGAAPIRADMSLQSDGMVEQVQMHGGRGGGGMGGGGGAISRGGGGSVGGGAAAMSRGAGPGIGGGAAFNRGGGPGFSRGVINRGANFSGDRVARGGNFARNFDGRGDWRGRHRFRGSRFAFGFAPGFYDYGYYDYGYPYYDDYAYGDDYVAVSPGGDAASCAQRFRSYDPSTGTYLGYDGLRHPCP